MPPREHDQGERYTNMYTPQQNCALEGRGKQSSPQHGPKPKTYFKSIEAYKATADFHEAPESDLIIAEEEL